MQDFVDEDNSKKAIYDGKTHFKNHGNFDV